MLKQEAEYTLFDKDTEVQTAYKIGNYGVALDLLIRFIHEQNIRNFVLCFAKFDIRIANILDCFRGYNGCDQRLMKSKRIRANRLFANVCEKMMKLFSSDSLLESFKDVQINESTVRDFFAGEYKQSLDGIEEGDDLSDFQ